MKVTAIIPDEIIEEVMRLSQAGSITKALKIALQEYISRQKIKQLSSSVLNKPLEFNYSAKELRRKF